MTPNAEIRKANPTEAPAISEIVNAAYEKYVPRIGRPPQPMLEDYSALIRENVVWVLAKGTDVIGVLVLKEEADHFLLDNVALREDMQGQGFGKRLLEYAERMAKERGYNEIRLYTNEKMTENIDLYKKIGYRETHREAATYRRVFMSKLLPSNPSSDT
jgi:GNAT superfamily N-acetyltransferase